MAFALAESIDAIARDTGFRDQKYFSRKFMDYMGIAPSAYRAKFAQDWRKT